jgi:hypothetical protein
MLRLSLGVASALEVLRCQHTRAKARGTVGGGRKPLAYIDQYVIGGPIRPASETYCPLSDGCAYSEATHYCRVSVSQISGRDASLL